MLTRQTIRHSLCTFVTLPRRYPGSPSLIKALAVLVVMGMTRATAADAGCRAVSAAEQTPLVELFTSDGCSSCPPANQWLSSALATRRAAVIPVSLHVTYWNYLGWRDAYSDAFFDQRQNWYAQRATNRFPYTPEFFRNGLEWRGWRDRDTEHEDGGARAPVTLTVELSHGTSGTRNTLDAQVVVGNALPDAVRGQGDRQLVVFLYEDGVSEHPDAGELRGASLKHDHVVRAWRTFDHPGFMQANDVHFLLPPDTNAARTGLVAFVQDRSSGVVLQAIDVPYCR